MPYSDSFSVITRIDIESTAVDPAVPSCHLALRTEVKWLKTVWMLKSTIESKSIEGNTQFLTHWLDVVKRKATEIEVVRGLSHLWQAVVVSCSLHTYRRLAPARRPLGASRRSWTRSHFRILQTFSLPPHPHPPLRPYLRSASLRLWPRRRRRPCYVRPRHPSLHQSRRRWGIALPSRCHLYF